MRIAVIGLGKLGSVLAAVLADKGHQVIGSDLNLLTVRAINEKRAPVEEPGLSELISRAPCLKATADSQQAALASDIIFIVVPTPSEPDGSFSLCSVLPAMTMIGRALREKDSFSLVALSSTVLPGTMEHHVLPLLERVSGKRCGEDFGLCYNPEFIALGSVIRDMHNPDMVLIGESDPRSGQILEDLYLGVCANSPAIIRTNFINAELAKISLNTYVTTKISFANMLAGICEKLPGADVDEVTRALGMDSRIGSKYLKGALGYAGPCFPRDCAAFSYVADSVDAGAAIAEATDSINHSQISRLISRITLSAPPGCRIGVLGLSYKPDTGVIEESQSISLIQDLLERGYRVSAYDPMAMPNTRIALPGLQLWSSAQECLNNSQLIVIATAWDKFKHLKPEQLSSAFGRPIIVDCWRILDRSSFEQVSDYMTIGEGPKKEVAISAGL